MKKILTILLVLALSLTVLVGCDILADLGININIGGEQPDTPDENPDEKPDETPEVDADLQAAYDYVHQITKTIAEVTGANYEVTGAAPIGDKSFTVVWDVSDDRIELQVSEDGTIVTVVVPSKTYEDIPYTLKFTVTNEKGESLSREYSHVVPAFKVSTFDEYMAAKTGDNLVVKGIVVAINAKSAGNTRNHLFLADEDVVGGYYSYQMDQDPLEMGIEVGMTVLVTGPASPYSGMQEIKGGVAEILSTEKKTVDFVDVTADFIAGDTLGKYTALPVVIKGVTIGGQELGGTSDYLKFSLNGRESYIRTYKTDFPTTLPASAKEVIDADHKAHFGWTADVYGLVVLYSNNPYLIPLSVDCFTNYVEVERTPAEKVATELDGLTIASKVTSDTVIELLANGQNYSDVAFAWTLAETEHATLADGKLTVVVPDSKATITLTVVATCGDASDTKSFEILLSKELTTIVDALAIGAAKDHNTYTPEKYLVGGVITEVYNDQYGNMYIVDAYGNTLTIYGTYDATGANRYDAMTAKPVAGDYVVILGSLGQFNGTAQIKNGWIVSWTTPTSVKDALDLGASKEHDTYTEDKYLVTGVITDVYNTKYGNMKITDAAGNILTVYGTYDANGVNRYDAMTYKPVVGDTVTVLGIVGQYNGTAQLKNAWIVAVTKGGDTPVDPDPNPSTGVVDPVVGTAYNFGMIHEGVGTDVYYVCGGMAATYYFATSSDVSAALEIYLETAEGGYYMYAMIDGVKTYINYVVSGTHVNAKYESTPTTVFTYDATLQTVVTAVDGANYVLGTSSSKTYTAVGPVKPDGSYYCKFYATSAGGDTPVDPDPDPNPGTDEYVEMTVAEALQAAVGTKVKLTGTVSEFYQTWSDQYKNVSPYITDESGAKIIIFRTTVNVSLGDVVTVTGEIGAYNEVNQIAQGNELTIVEAHVCSEWTEATCKDLAECVVCGKTTGSLADHVYVNGKCECGAEEGVSTITASKTMKELITSEGWTDSTTKQTFALDEVVTVKVDGGNNSGKAYNGDHIRIYATDSPAGTLTISVAEGYELVSIKVTTVTGTYAFLYVDGQSDDICNTTVAVSGTSVVLNSVKNGSNGKQVRVLAIDVEYKAVG